MERGRPRSAYQEFIYLEFRAKISPIIQFRRPNMSKHTVQQRYLDHFKLTPSLYASYTDKNLQPETTRVLGAWGDLEKNTLSFVVSTPFWISFWSIFLAPATSQGVWDIHLQPTDAAGSLVSLKSSGFSRGIRRPCRMNFDVKVAPEDPGSRMYIGNECH